MYVRACMYIQRFRRGLRLSSAELPLPGFVFSEWLCGTTPAEACLIRGLLGMHLRWNRVNGVEGQFLRSLYGSGPCHQSGCKVDYVAASIFVPTAIQAQETWQRG